MKLERTTVKRYNLATSKVPDDFNVFGKIIPVPQYNFSYPKPSRKEVYKNIIGAKKRLGGKHAIKKG